MIRTQKILLFSEGDAVIIYVNRDHSFEDCTYVAKSHALFCPGCQEVWAILRFVDEDEVWPVAQFCEHCVPSRFIESPWYPVPGSLLVEEGWGVIDEALLAVLPEQLLKREIKLHLKAYQ